MKVLFKRFFKKEKKKFIKSELKMMRSTAAARELDILVEVSGSPQ